MMPGTVVLHLPTAQIGGAIEKAETEIICIGFLSSFCVPSGRLGLFVFRGEN